MKKTGRKGDYWLATLSSGHDTGNQEVIEMDIQHQILGKMIVRTSEIFQKKAVKAGRRHAVLWRSLGKIRKLRSDYRPSGGRFRFLNQLHCIQKKKNVRGDGRVCRRTLRGIVACSIGSVRNFFCTFSSWSSCSSWSNPETLAYHEEHEEHEENSESE